MHWLLSALVPHWFAVSLTVGTINDMKRSENFKEFLCESYVTNFIIDDISTMELLLAISEDVIEPNQPGLLTHREQLLLLTYYGKNPTCDK